MRLRIARTLQLCKAAAVARRVVRLKGRGHTVRYVVMTVFFLSAL